MNAIYPRLIGENIAPRTKYPFRKKKADTNPIKKPKIVTWAGVIPEKLAISQVILYANGSIIKTAIAVIGRFFVFSIRLLGRPGIPVKKPVYIKRKHFTVCQPLHLPYERPAHEAIIIKITGHSPMEKLQRCGAVDMDDTQEALKRFGHVLEAWDKTLDEPRIHTRQKK